MGLGLGPGFVKGGGFAMGQFQSPSRGTDSQSRFDASNNARGAMPFAGPAGSRLTPMARSANQGGVGGGGPREGKRTRSQRGNNRGMNGMRGSGFQTPLQHMARMNPGSVEPLEGSENQWVGEGTQPQLQQLEGNQLINRKVKALLNKLTMNTFDSISDQIIAYANKSEQEKDGLTLMQVIKLLFGHVKEDARFGEMYARLCRKMMERVSPNVRDETIRDSDGQPVAGGMLLRKYLLNQCQEDFEGGWNAKEAALAAAASKKNGNEPPELKAEGSGEPAVDSDEYYAATKAKRRGLCLVNFIGELFKLFMLTERIMHECIKKLLSNIVNPKEEDIESLCKLLTTVGQTLDNPKARNHMDIYFERMNEMIKGSNVKPRMQFLLLDVIELRSRRWQARSGIPQLPPQLQGKGDRNTRRGGSRRGERRDTAEPDGWNVGGGTSTRPPARAGDLSQFGKISKSSALKFGPSSVFSKRDPSHEANLSRAGSANMFAALGAGGGGITVPALTERMPSGRGPSVNFGTSGAPTGERKKLNLAPRTKPLENKEGDMIKAPAPKALSEADAKQKVKEDVSEYLGVQNVDEAIMALAALPVEHRHVFVTKLVSSTLDGGSKVIVLAEKLLVAARKRGIVSTEGFERGFLPIIECADDISIDVPKTYEWLSQFLIAAGLETSKVKELAGKIVVEGSPTIHPRDQFLKAYEKHCQSR